MPVHDGTCSFHPMLTKWKPHVPSDALMNMFFIAACISLHCCGSASFTKNRTRSLSHLGTSVGVASLNTHLRLNLCWFVMKIHNHTTCWPIDRRDKKVRRWKPLLLKWEVTSTQTTLGHSLNKQNMGFPIQATPMKSVSSLSRFLSSLSWTICWVRHEISDSSSISWHWTSPEKDLVVEIVTASDESRWRLPSK